MILHRLIPVLTFFQNRLIKTKNFDIENSVYLGDVLNSVRLFNDKKAEELIISDIGATINNTKPNFELIKKISSVSRMPVCYGGGIKNLDDCIKITSYGIEKISISSERLFSTNQFIFKLVNSFSAMP